MAADHSGFDELMSLAHRVTVALDSVTRHDGPKAVSLRVKNGKRVYSQLLEYQRTRRMTPGEAHSLHDVLERLQARLKFLGETV